MIAGFLFDVGLLLVGFVILSIIAHYVDRAVRWLIKLLIPGW